MRFNYTAKSTTGAVATGTLDAESSLAAQQMLREQGLYPLNMKPAGNTWSAKSRGAKKRRGKITKRDLLGLTSQLAIMVKTGIDLSNAIKTASKQCENERLQEVLHDVHDRVSAGMSVSAALRRHSKVFGEAYIASVTAGEASGKLTEVFDRLAVLLRGELRLRSTTRSLMAYPVVLASVSFCVICGLVFFVLPQFADVFKQFDVPLPLITQWLIAISSELAIRWWIYVPAAVGVGYGARSFLRSEQGQLLRDHFLLNGTLIREVTRALLVGRAFRLLGLMLQSGVPLLDSLQMTRASINNRLYRDLFDKVERAILNGDNMGDALAEAPFIPPAAVQMIMTGQRTGTLGLVTTTMGEFYEEEGETRLRDLASVMEPMIIIVMGVVVATVVLSVMLPMFEFATFAQKGS